jgi:hypothetical protein
VAEWIRSGGSLILDEKETKSLRHYCDILFDYYSRYGADHIIEVNSNFYQFICDNRNKFTEKLT